MSYQDWNDLANSEKLGDDAQWLSIPSVRDTDQELADIDMPRSLLRFIMYFLLLSFRLEWFIHFYSISLIYGSFDSVLYELSTDILHIIVALRQFAATPPKRLCNTLYSESVF